MRRPDKPAPTFGFRSVRWICADCQAVTGASSLATDLASCRSCVDSYALISAPTHSQDSQTSFMPPASRDHARIERRLIAALTDACEIAKAEIPGFEWLTHTVDYRAFPQSLRVTWVFDSVASKAHALATGADARMRELTTAALDDADVHVPNIARCVSFDSEEECHLRHGGDWRRRLANVRAI